MRRFGHGNHSGASVLAGAADGPGRDGRSPELGFDWVRPFSEEAIAVMTQRPAEAAQLVSHRDFSRVAPTPEHFLPLLYIAGFAAATGEMPKVLVDGYAYGSLSMTCYGLDAACPKAEDEKPAASLPDPDAIPAEDTNT